ncbi:MAG: 50S ribosomal protein L13 [Bacteroidaceae bacterium]|jgi:large subunit ribosomal protein L13|nr:50S ribosomal protein L13 [Bacteroidaceae bacterium]
MNTLSFKTNYVNTEAANKQWVVVDASGQTLGRLASKVAQVLRGKYKPCFTPNMDCGDNVIIINANKIQVSGAKETQKLYITFSGYAGGQKKATFADMTKRANGYEKILRHAIKGMLPKGILGRHLSAPSHLKVFEGPEHNMQAQKPISLDINTLK